MEKALALTDSIKSIIGVLKLSRKSDREEFFLYIKLVLLGVVVTGSIGFAIQLVSSLLRLSG